jgi:hypothetical protein
VRSIIEFNKASPMREDAGEAAYKALVSVLGSVGDFRIVRDGATFVGYFKGKDQPIIWMEVSREP